MNSEEKRPKTTRSWNTRILAQRSRERSQLPKVSISLKTLDDLKIPIPRRRKLKQLLTEESVEPYGQIETHVQTPQRETYFKMNKELSKAKSIHSIKNIDQNIYFKMLTDMESNNLIPKTLQLIGTKNTETLNISGQITNKQYLHMFLEGLGTNTYEKLKDLNMSNTDLSEEQLQQFIDHCPKMIKVLDLSNTHLIRRNAIQLNSLLLKNRIKVLNLSKNNISDLGVIELLKGNKMALRVLDLSDNKIGDNAMQFLGEYIEESELEILYLHYNFISGRGGQLFFNGLKNNDQLKVLDISANKLGSGIGKCMINLCKMIAKPHPSLVHLDISRNFFQPDDGAMLAKEICLNQIIYGIHYENNSGGYSVNSKQFLIKESEMRINRIKSVTDVEPCESFGQNRILANEIVRPAKEVNCCWICEGWVQVRFEHRGESPMFLHLDFEGWQPTYMFKEDAKCVIYRMCPPGQTIQYFYSSPTVGIFEYARDQMNVSTGKSELSRGINIKYNDGTIMETGRMAHVNYLTPLKPQQIIQNYNAIVDCKPRQPEKIIQLKRVHTKWTVQNSIFSDALIDQQHLANCLDADLAASKLFQHLKDQPTLKQDLLAHYTQILQCYRLFCSYSLNYDFPRLSALSIQQLYDQVSQYVKLVDWQLGLVTSLTLRDKKPYTHERGLTRFQFIEMLLRIHKEMKINLSLCFKTGLSFVNSPDLTLQWKEERYWSQIMEITIQFKMPLIRSLFYITASLSIKKTQTREKFVSLQEFKMLFETLEISPKYITEQELYFIYQQSMLIQVDELTKLRHVEMRLMEFIEGIARVIDQVSPNSPFYKKRSLSNTERKELPLYVKLEGFLYIAYYKLKAQFGQNNLEKTIVTRSVVTTVEYASLGLFADDRIDLEETDSSDNIMKQILYDLDVIQKVQEQTNKQAFTSQSWKKIRNLIKVDEQTMDSQTNIY